MRNLCFGSVALLTLAAADPAVAADIPVKARPVPIVAPLYNWTGFYIGGHIGVGWSDNRMTDIDGYSSRGVLGKVTNYDRSGVIGGGQIGANWQFGSIVLGVEGDISAAGLSKSTNQVDAIDLDETARTRYDWIATVRGRVGFTMDRVLVYGTGGVAFASILNELRDTDAGVFDPVDSFSSKSTRTGWVAGGGIEYAFASNWTARAEGLYMDFGNRTYVVDIGGTNSRFRVDNTLVVGRVGLNYKFGDFGKGPVVSRY